MKKILFAKPSITKKEIDYVNDAVSNGWGENCYDYIHRFTDKLKEYFNSPYVWPTSSCHGALHIILMSLKIGRGDEVITQSFNFIATVEAIVDTGANVVFTDIDDTLNMCPKNLESLISKKLSSIFGFNDNFLSISLHLLL